MNVSTTTSRRFGIPMTPLRNESSDVRPGGPSMDEQIRDFLAAVNNTGHSAEDAIDANTTVDVIIHADGSITEVSDTIDAMDGAAVEVIDITNEQDGTDIELTIIEESTATSGVDGVDRFVQIDGIGPRIADLLAKAGIRRFAQLAETPVERLLDILTATDVRYRIHDAKAWQEQARRLATGRTDEVKHLRQGTAQA